MPSPPTAFWKVKEFGVRYCSSVAFPHGFCSSKQKYAGLGTPQVARLPLARLPGRRITIFPGGVGGLGVGCAHLPVHLKVGGAGGRFTRICGCAPLGRGGPGGEEEEGGGYRRRRRRRPGLGLSGKLLSCDGDDEVKMADLSKYNPGPWHTRGGGSGGGVTRAPSSAPGPP